MAKTVNGYPLNETGDPAPWSEKETAFLTAMANLAPVSGSTFVNGEHKHTGLFASGASTPVVSTVPLGTLVSGDLYTSGTASGASGEYQYMKVSGDSAELLVTTPSGTNVPTLTLYNTTQPAGPTEFQTGGKIVFKAFTFFPGLESEIYTIKAVANDNEGEGELQHFVGDNSYPRVIFNTIGIQLSGVGDVYTEQWTDYSSSSTIVGWTSTTTEEIFYKVVGNMVYVSFVITGTSDSTATSFTLPYNTSSSGPTELYSPTVVTDNSVVQTSPGLVKIANNSNVANCYPDYTGSSTWTNSGTKTIGGEFWYRK